MARMITRQEAATLLNVTPQTISNWVEKGMLKVHNNRNGRNLYTIDSKSIVKLFDKLEDLAIMEKNIDVYKQQLKAELSLLETNIKDTSSANNLFGHGVPKYLLRTVFSCVAEVAGNTILSEREYQVIDSLIAGVPLHGIAMEYGVSKTRIMQIVNKSIQKITSMKKWPQMHEEYKRVSAENQRITAMLESQRLRNKELEAQLGMKETIGDEISLVPGYTKVQLAKTLATKLANCNLTVRTLNCMKTADIETVGDLIKYTKVDLLKQRNLGKKSLRELDDLLDSMNLTFGMDVERIIDAQVEAFLKENQKQVLN